MCAITNMKRKNIYINYSELYVLFTKHSIRSSSSILIFSFAYSVLKKFWVSRSESELIRIRIWFLSSSSEIPFNLESWNTQIFPPLLLNPKLKSLNRITLIMSLLLLFSESSKIFNKLLCKAFQVKDNKIASDSEFSRYQFLRIENLIFKTRGSKSGTTTEVFEETGIPISLKIFPLNFQTSSTIVKARSSSSKEFAGNIFCPLLFCSSWRASCDWAQ